MNINLLVEAKLKHTHSLKFIIHEHHAEKAGLHYDLRLERNGVLLSWATRKMPQLIAGELPRIMLFQQPDHQLSWFDFKGDIDDGYGKGKVLIWDKGVYDTLKWDDRHISVYFHGTKLNGKYSLLSYRNNWLMFRHKGGEENE